MPSAENYNVTSELFFAVELSDWTGKTWTNPGREQNALLAGGGPALRLNPRKNRIAQFNRLKFFDLLGRNLMGGFKAAPAIEQSTELLQVSIKAFFGVVASVLGGDQELPVRGFQEQQFTAELAGEPCCHFMAAPQAAVSHLLYSHFRGIDVLPGPGGILVE